MAVVLRKQEDRLGNVMKHFTAMEKLAFASLLFAAGTAQLFRLQFYFPSLDALLFVARHYLGPLLPALALPVFLLARHLSRSGAEALLGHRLRAIGALALIVYVHFNLKLWAQLINPFLFDDVYMAVDERLRSLVHLASALAAGYRNALGQFPHAYHEVFVAMFVVSFTVHGMQSDSRGFDRLLLAVSLVLVVGGASYAIAPAWGPFVYEAGDNPEATAIQATMASFQGNLRASHGGEYDTSYFVAALAAMPSLHLAHALVFFYFALRYVRWLGLVYILPVTFIATEAVASRWHYLVDLPAGLVVAFCAVLLAYRFIPRPLESPQPSTPCASPYSS